MIAYKTNRLNESSRSLTFQKASQFEKILISGNSNDVAWMKIRKGRLHKGAGPFHTNSPERGPSRQHFNSSLGELDALLYHQVGHFTAVIHLLHLPVFKY